MGSFRATLEVSGKSADVLFSNIEFSRKTDSKGKPVTGILGGRLSVTIEASEDTSIIETMLNFQCKPINGKIAYIGQDKDVPLRTTEFYNAYVVFYKETFSSAKKYPMTVFVTFSAEEIVIGRAFLQNRW